MITKKKKKRIIISIIIVLLLLGVGGVFLKHSKTSVVAPQTYEIVKKNIDFTYTITGVVESEKIVSVFADNATTVDKVNFRINDTVNKGDILLTFKPNDDNNTQRLNVEKAKAVLPLLREEYEAAKKVFSAGGISKSELNKAKEALESAVIDMKIASSGYKASPRVLIAPISGVITEANADDNYKIDPTRPLYKIEDTENLKITLEVPNYKAKNLSIGQEVTVSSDSLENNEVLSGNIKRIGKISKKSDNTNDAVTLVEVSLNNYSNLKPGDTVEAKISYLSLKNKLIIPLQYILYENNQAYTFILNKKNIVEKRKLVLGKNDNINYEVISGISEHDRLINNSEGLYKEGDKF